MSGHSHAKTVKRVKEANAAKRGKIFSKLAKMISVAAKNGPDPATNSKLRQALEEAKKANMPKENVERAIQKGAGPGESEQLEEVTYEALGPEAISLIIEGITDNKNRALSEVKQILQKNNFKLAGEGAVKWAFGQKGIILSRADTLLQQGKTKEDIELLAIEAGADDIKWFFDEDEEFLEIRTQPSDLEPAKKALETAGLKIESSNLGWVAKEETNVSEKTKEAAEKLFEELDDSETVQDTYSNLKE